MDGKTLAKICDDECLKRGIKKAEFYNAIGLSAPSFHGWKNGATPSDKYVRAIENYFGIDLSVYNANQKNETIELAEILRDRQDLRILLRSAKDVPASNVYQLIAQVEKWKEEES